MADLARRLSKVLGCFVSVAFLYASASTAHALCITNGTDWGVRVHFYNSTDKIMAIAMKGLEIESGKAGTWNVGRGEGDTFNVKIFWKLMPLDQLAVAEQGLGRGGKYILVKEGNTDKGRLYDTVADASKLSAKQKRQNKCK